MKEKASRYCQELCEKLAADKAAALRGDDIAQEHLAQCSECFEFFEALTQLDPLFAELPAYDPGEEAAKRALERIRHSAPQSVAKQAPVRRRLSSIFAAIFAAPGRLSRSARRLPRRRLIWPGAALGATVCLALFFVKANRSAFMAAESRPTFNSVGTDLRRVGSHSAGSHSAGSHSAGVSAEREDDGIFDRLSGALSGGGSEFKDQAAVQPSATYENRVRSSKPTESSTRLERYQVPQAKEPHRKRPPASAPAPRPAQVFDEKRQEAGAGLAAEPGNALSEADTVEAFAQSASAAEPRVPGTVMAYWPREPRLDDREANLPRGSSGDAKVMVNGWIGKSRVPELNKLLSGKDVVGSNTEHAQWGQFDGDERKEASGVSPLDELLAGRERTEGLVFKQPSGYWANTYLPGDATMRRLRTALLAQNGARITTEAGTPLELHALSQQPAQPFDAPENSALAIFLHSDRAGIEGKSRMLVQVGLKGSERKAGSRGAMNVAVVLDARGPVDEQTAAQMRDLLLALNAAKDIGDRFSLFVAGRPNDYFLPPSEFKHGPLTINMKKLIADRTIPPAGRGLRETVESAIAAASDSDDPGSPLGSSMVLLITGQPVGAELEQLLTVAHQSAVAGIPLSAIGIGNSYVSSELDRLVLSGQGNRRTLISGHDAKKVIEDELFAVSRVVARAVRLRIRLAAGVKLVDVIGSYRLDDLHAERVRQAEQSIDRRIARNLGIEADRGEDEEGIQIVIPAYYSGDEHVILLDVVAEGPGPIADVTARYKDLVYLRNGVSRANLTLKGTSSSMRSGPLERNVTKNFLAFRFAADLSKSGANIQYGDFIEAAALLENQRTLLQELQRRIPGFERDPDIAADLAMIENYLTALRSQSSARPELRELLANSLEYAGKLKTTPEPDFIPDAR